MAKKIISAIQKKDAPCFVSGLEVSGCQSRGESLDELMNNIKEAMELYWEALAAQEKENRLSR